MDKTNIFVGALFVGLISVACIAQEEEEAQEGPIGYVYATYSYCVPEGQDEDDKEVAEVAAPIYNKMIDEGVINSWGYLAHHTGGMWRRLFYFQNDTVDGLLDGLDDMQARFEALPDDDEDDSDNPCWAHDDYIWSIEAGNPGANEGGADAGLSVYYVCNESREERADELVQSTFAPLLDKAVSDGKIASWSWLSHFIGGKYRRLQTMIGADHKAVLSARADLLEALYGGDEPNAAAVEFNEICGSHSDYLWNIQLSSP